MARWRCTVVVYVEEELALSLEIKRKVIEFDPEATYCIDLPEMSLLSSVLSKERVSMLKVGRVEL